MPDVSLGRLERITELRTIWSSEAIDFTPWLGRAENLDVLGNTLGIEISLEAQERRVGPFRADILCRDLGTGSWVLVENQLERTDHGHLGQLLTYAAGLEAVTIVWIAASFTDEHRATLDWLNKITDQSFRFFGVEIELWRIGSSPIAPRFNIIAKPNGWTRSIAEAKRAIDDEEPTTGQILQRDYWTALHQELEVQHGPVSGNRTAQPQAWMNYKIGRAGFSLTATMIRPRKEIRAELYIDGHAAKSLFRNLRQQQNTIENELGHALDWAELPTRRACRISTSLRPADADDTADWSRQLQWLAVRLNELHRVFAVRVRTLDADVVEPGPDTDVSDESIQAALDQGAAMP